MTPLRALAATFVFVALLSCGMPRLSMAQPQTHRSPPVNAQPWSAQPVALIAKPVLEGSRVVAMDFRFEFDAPLQPELMLRLPNAWGGETQLYQHWRDLRASGARILPGEAPHLRKLVLEPGAKVVLSYRVVSRELQDASARSPSLGNDYRPEFAATYFHLLGNAVVPHIEGMWGGSPARFELQGMPQAMAFASDLEHQSMGRKLTVLDLSESVMVGGDFRVLDAGQGARIAIRGKWPRADEEWRSQFSRIAAAQRAYWRSAPEAFLVTITELPISGPGNSSVGGTGRSDAFAFFATPNANPATLDRVMAHEMMHTWIPRRIGNLPIKQQELSYWLSEGFTDWASWRSMVAAGLWTAQDFAAKLNEDMQEHDMMAVRSASMAEIADGFWRNPDMAKMPYRRGMLFALWLDERLLAATAGKTGLDDVLRHMSQIAPPDAAERGGARAVLVQAVRELAALDITAELASHIDAGKPLALAPNTLAECGDLSEIQRPVFHRGFDVDATMKAGNVIQGLVRGSPAERAGLKNGMKILRRTAGKMGDARVDIAYELQDGNAVKTLRWLPAGEGVETFREFRLKDVSDAAAQSACLKRLRGV